MAGQADKKPKWVVAKERSRNGQPDTVWLFGLHAVRDALRNPNRQKLRLMVTKNAADRLGEALEKVQWNTPNVPVISNVTGEPHHGEEASGEEVGREAFTEVAAKEARGHQGQFECRVPDRAQGPGIVRCQAKGNGGDEAGRDEAHRVQG